MQFEKTVLVWDEPHTVEITRKSKVVWIAVGHYKGQRLEAKGNTASSAVLHWRDAARYRGN